MGQKRPQRQCIFCGRKGVSKEHIYSQWIAPILPAQKAAYYNEDKLTTIAKVVQLAPELRTRPGSVTTKKVRAACAACNNGWMSLNEEAARPYLTPMIRGEPIALDSASQEIIARWIAMKIIVAEHAKPGLAVTPQTDRTALMLKGTVPAYFNIYAAPHRAESDVGFMRNALTVSLDYSGPKPPLDGMPKNLQQATLLIGRLFIQVNAARLDDFSIEDRLIPILYSGIRIWPIERPAFNWSETRTLTANDVFRISGALNALVSHSQVKWGGMEVPASWDSGAEP
ncbi:MAG: hypothetical protein M3Y78_01395 [Pseudomonadota bacterium]|nr:hypothetical protein [Pseudomonadota bacterium]